MEPIQQPTIWLGASGEFQMFRPSMIALGLSFTRVLSVTAAGVPQSEESFVKMASIGNGFEIAEARLALQKATDPRLKAFAQHMIDDHGDAQKTLGTAAGKIGGATLGDLDPSHQATLDNLGTFTGTDFDKIYIADQIAAHAETVALLSDYYQNGTNADLKGWANKALPTVKAHRADIDAM
jgi:putative membrane protein